MTRPVTRLVVLSALAAVALGMLSAFTVGAPSANHTESTAWATLPDPARDDAPAEDLDLTSVSLATQKGDLLVRFTLRGPVTDNVRFTADVAVNISRAAVVAERVDGRDVLYVDGEGGRRRATGSIQGRTVTVVVPIARYMQSARRTGGTLVRVRARFTAQPAGARKGVADYAPGTAAHVTHFCLSDLRPRPRLGPCIWPKQT